MLKILPRVLFVPLLWFVLSVQADQGAKDYYTVGLVPQQSATKLARLWTPILNYLSEHSGIKLRFKTAPDIPEFERRLAKGEYDIAYMNPYHYTVFHESPGYVAFAHEAGKRLKGILVVRKDSSIQRLEDLNGKTLAFPAPAAFAASVLPRSYLQKLGIQFRTQYVASHDSVYRAVAKGLYPAGGGVMRTLNSIDIEISQQLRILWTTEGYTPHAFAAHPSLPIGLVDRLLHAMLDMSKDPEGKRLLEIVNISAFAAAFDNEWDDVRGLNIQLLDELTDE